MFEAPAKAFRVSGSGAFDALTPVLPDAQSDRPLLLDWCLAQGHTLLHSSPLFPLVRETTALPGLHIDLLLLTETGTLVAVLVNLDPPPSPAPLLGTALTAAHWCEGLKYDDLEELFNAESEEPRSLQEAHREHFGNLPELPVLPSALNQSYLVLLILPQGTGSAMTPLLSFLAARSLPVMCLEYACFQAADDRILLIAPVGDTLLAAAEAPKVEATTVGDVSEIVEALDAEEPPPPSEPTLESLARRQPKEPSP